MTALHARMRTVVIMIDFPPGLLHFVENLRSSAPCNLSELGQICRLPYLWLIHSHIPIEYPEKTVFTVWLFLSQERELIVDAPKQINMYVSLQTLILFTQKKKEKKKTYVRPGLIRSSKEPCHIERWISVLVSEGEREREGKRGRERKERKQH